MFLRSHYSVSKIWLGLLLLNCLASAAEFGIAAKYAKDQNLAYDPDVIALWDYEDGENFRYGWAGGLRGYSRSTDPANLLLGQNSLKSVLYEGTNGNGDYMIIASENSLFQRWYMKLDAGFQFSATGMKIHGFGGYGTGQSPTVVQGAAGIRPDGTNKMYAIIYMTADNRTGLYYYHPDQRGGWGDQVTFGPTIETGRWYCYEIMVKVNTPGQYNGEMKCWLDGNLVHSNTSLRWRTVNSLAINLVLDHTYNPVVKNQNVHFDNRVVARKYIGPASGTGPNSPPIPTTILPVPRDTILPSVGNLFPAANATDVAAKTMITFHIRDDRGVDSTSLLMKVNGAAVKPKVTGFQRDLTVTYPNPAGYASGSVVTVAINAKDISGNSMPTHNYSFTIAGTPGIARGVPIVLQQNADAKTKAFDMLGRSIATDKNKGTLQTRGAYVEQENSRNAKRRIAKPQ